MSQSQILNYVKNITETLNQWRANAKKTEELPAASVIDPDNLLMISVFENGVWVSKKLEIQKIIDGLSLSGQDNKIREVLLGTITEEDTLNYLLDNNGITVTESEIIVLTALVTIDNQLVQRQFLWKKGKGEYNPIGSDDINDKLLELQPKFLSEINAEELTNSPRAIVYDFGVITDPILDILNNASPARDYTDDERIYYIRATKDGVNLLYNFIGVNGVYGDGELQMTVDDLVLVYSSKNTDISTLLNNKTDRGGYTGTSQGLANRIDFFENFGLIKQDYAWIGFNETGVLTDFELIDGGGNPGQSIRFIGSVEEIESFFFAERYPYNGSGFYFKNEQSTPIKLPHEKLDISTTVGRFIWSFPDEQDLIVNPNQIFEFKVNSFGNRGKIEFVGLKGVDESNLVHKTGDEEIDGFKKLLKALTISSDGHDSIFSTREVDGNTITSLSVKKPDGELTRIFQFCEDPTFGGYYNFHAGDLDPSSHNFFFQVTKDGRETWLNAIHELVLTLNDQAFLWAKDGKVAVGYDWGESTPDAKLSVKGNVSAFEASQPEHLVPLGQMVTYVDSKIVGIYKFKGNKTDYADLIATTDMQVGDVYNLLSNEKNYGWTGTLWDDLGGTFDVSGKEDVSNKSNDIEGDKTSTSKYASIKAIYDWAINLFVKKHTPVFTGEVTFSDYPSTRNDGALPSNKVLSVNASGKIGLYTMSVSPAPWIRELIPDSYLPDTTSNIRILGDFFTPTMCDRVNNANAIILGGVTTIHYATFVSSQEILINVTTGIVEGTFSCSLDNGLSTTKTDALLIVLGTVYEPKIDDWINVIDPIEFLDVGSVNLKVAYSPGSAIWSKILDVSKNFEIRFNAKLSPLMPILEGSDNNVGFNPIVQIMSTLDDSVLWAYKNFRNSYLTFNRNTQHMEEFNMGRFTRQKIRYIDGIWYCYVNNNLVYTSSINNNLTDNVYLKFSPSGIDLENIKFIELAT